MATSQTRWNIVVSKQTDQGLREFLAGEGRGKKGDISLFVEEAVKKHIFDSAVRAAREHNKDVPFEEMQQIIEESLAWARAQKH